jgi:hypothetical protein
MQANAVCIEIHIYRIPYTQQWTQNNGGRRQPQKEAFTRNAHALLFVNTNCVLADFDSIVLIGQRFVLGTFLSFY